MKLPKSFVIKGERWDVRISDELADKDWAAQSDPSNREIKIHSDVSARDLKQTLLHEFFHACIKELHVVLEAGVEEVIVDGMAKCLIESFHVRPR